MDTQKWFAFGQYRCTSGKNTKMHLMNVSLSGGHIYDSEPALDLFAEIKLNGKTFLADKAYSCDKIRDYNLHSG